MSNKSIYKSPTYFYTYLITNTKENKYYIGSRQCEIDPIKDLGIKYFSSSHDKEFILDQKQNPDDYEYRVLGLFPSRKECMKGEVELHEAYNVSSNPSFYNRANCTSTGFNTSGRVSVKDKGGNTMKVTVNDPRYLSRELVGVAKGTVTVKDKGGNTMKVDVDDPRYLSGELVGVNKGTVAVKDEGGKIMQVPVNDPRFLSGELEHVSKGMATVKDKDGNTMKVDVDDPRFLSGELEHVSKGTVTVKDEGGKIMQVPVNDPRFLSGELEHVSKGMATVKDKDGNTMQVPADDPRIVSGELVGVTKGTMWITNAEEKKNKRIKKTGPIPDGWVRGRKFFK